MKASLSARLLAVMAVAMLGAGCGLLPGDTPAPNCPPIFVLKDVGTLTRYGPGSGKDITDVLFQAKIADFRGVCDYNKKLTKVTIDLVLTFELSRGPANRDRKAAFQYFVAIPHFHPAPEGRRTFPITVEFAPQLQRASPQDEIQLVIPLDPKRPLDDYAIYLGLQLTREELEDNRRITKF